jgi:hypothetical protein
LQERPPLPLDVPLQTAALSDRSSRVSPTNRTTGPASPRRVSALLVALFVAGVTACSTVGPTFGDTPAAAKANMNDFFGAAINRYTDVQRSAKFTLAREQFGKYALSPTTIYRDTAVWTIFGPDSTRSITVDGEFSGGSYRFVTRPTPAPVDMPGDSRHHLRLTRLSESEFEWWTNVDMAFGRATAGQLGKVVSVWMGGAEGLSGSSIRSAYRTVMPRTTTALGRLFTMDSIRTAMDTAGATTVWLTFTAHPKRLESHGFPDFAKFIDKHIVSITHRIVATDRTGARWLEATGKEGRYTFRFRSYHGRFVPLDGSLRKVPDTLRVEMNIAKEGFFTVGFSKLQSELVIENTENERSWSMHFRKEPEWRLPPVVKHLIRTPLRRPFQDKGVTFYIGFKSSPSMSQTLLVRQANGVVQESAILRFLGRFSAGIMGDFIGKSEEEENRFNAELFAAMKADMQAQVP